MPEWRESLAQLRWISIAATSTAVIGLVAALRRHEAGSENGWLPSWFLLGLTSRRRRDELEATDAWAPEAAEQLANVGNSEDIQVASTSENVVPQASTPPIAETTEPNREPTPTVDPQTGLMIPPPPSAPPGRERVMGLRTLLTSLQGCDRVCPESIMGPFQMNAGTEEEVPVVCFQFRMSHFTCKAYLAHGTQDEGSQHLKLQTTFEDNRRSLGEEQRYFIANEWNATKRYTRLKCGYGGAGRSSVFTLEYDVLVPAETPHTWGLLLLSQTLRMWYTSMVACVMHIVEPRDVPFATHEMITANTLSVAVREEDECLLQQSCPICFENFRVGEKVRRLPCMHLFHVVGADSEQSQGQHCNIDRHLVRDKQCPVCKTPVDFMERIDKNSLCVKISEGDSLVLPENTEATGSGSRQGQETLGDTTTQVNVAMTDTATSLAGLAAVAADAVSIAVPTVLSNGTENEVIPQPLPVPVSTTTGHSVVAVARGAAVQGIQAAAEVAAAAARMAPSVQQETNNGQTVGLPAQAAELERAVRSLQSRWMQIQDVVAGMQQMLQYIEESQSMMSAARTEQQAPPGTEVEISSNAPVVAITDSDQPIQVGGDVVEVSLEATRVENVEETAMVNETVVDIRESVDIRVSSNQENSTPEVTNGMHSASIATAEEEVLATEVLSTEASQERFDEPGTRVVQIPPESITVHRRVEEAPVETSETRAAQASMMSGLLQATLDAMRGRNLSAPPAPPAPPPPEVQRAPPAPSNDDRWQPFTEAEKVCMAYMWRWRRANLMGAASNATIENGRSDSSMPS